MKVQEKIDRHYEEIKIGDILLGSWGYEARYPEFYWVTNISNGYVVLYKLNKIYQGSTGNFYDDIRYYTTDGTIQEGAKSFRRKIKNYGQGDKVHYYVKINSYEHASLWDGSDQQEYNYH